MGAGTMPPAAVCRVTRVGRESDPRKGHPGGAPIEPQRPGPVRERGGHPEGSPAHRLADVELVLPHRSIRERRVTAGRRGGERALHPPAESVFALGVEGAEHHVRALRFPMLDGERGVRHTLRLRAPLPARRDELIGGPVMRARDVLALEAYCYGIEWRSRGSRIVFFIVVVATERQAEAGEPAFGEAAAIPAGGELSRFHVHFARREGGPLA